MKKDTKNPFVLAVRAGVPQSVAGWVSGRYVSTAASRSFIEPGYPTQMYKAPQPPPAAEKGGNAPHG